MALAAKENRFRIRMHMCPIHCVHINEWWVRRAARSGSGSDGIFMTHDKSSAAESVKRRVFVVCECSESNSPETSEARNPSFLEYIKLTATCATQAIHLFALACQNHIGEINFWCIRVRAGRQTWNNLLQARWRAACGVRVHCGRCVPQAIDKLSPECK